MDPDSMLQQLISGLILCVCVCVCVCVSLSLSRSLCPLFLCLFLLCRRWCALILHPLDVLLVLSADGDADEEDFRRRIIRSFDSRRCQGLLRTIRTGKTRLSCSRSTFLHCVWWSPFISALFSAGSSPPLPPPALARCHRHSHPIKYRWDDDDDDDDDDDPLEFFHSILARTWPNWRRLRLERFQI